MFYLWRNCDLQRLKVVTKDIIIVGWNQDCLEFKTPALTFSWLGLFSQRVSKRYGSNFHLTDKRDYDLVFHLSVALFLVKALENFM